MRERGAHIGHVKRDPELTQGGALNGSALWEEAKGSPKRALVAGNLEIQETVVRYIPKKLGFI